MPPRTSHAAGDVREQDSGKTTLLGLVSLLAPRGLLVIDPSPAVLYRMIEKWQPTLGRR